MLHLRRWSPLTQAAVVLLLCAGFNAIGRGIADSYIVFLVPLEQNFDWSRSVLTGVYSVCMLMSGLSAPLIGAAFDRFGPRAIYGLGVTSLAGGFLLASGSDQAWEFYFAIGLLCGVGVAALGVVPAAALLARWFRARLSAAMGIAYAGLGIGALAIVPLVQLLIDTYGWRDAYRYLGIALALLIPVAFALPWTRIATGRDDWSVPVHPEPRTGVIDVLRAATREPLFWQFAQVYFFTAMGIYLVNVQAIAFLVDAGFAPLTAATAYGVIGMLSVLGVTATGWVTDRFGHARAALASFFGTSSGILVLIAITVAPLTFLLPAYVVLFGLSQGARGPIVSSLAARVFPGRTLGTVYGAIYALGAIGGALGSWLSGVLHDLTQGYRVNFVCALVVLVIAAYPFFSRRSLLLASEPLRR